MTIRTRVAFGLVCAERACHHLGISNDRVRSIFTRLWCYTTAENLSAWGCRDGARDILEAADRAVAWRDCRFIYRLMKQLDEIGGGNLFGGFRNEFTLLPTLELCRLMKARQIELPPRRPFLRTSSRLTGMGLPNIIQGNWGRCYDGAHLRSLVTEGARSSA